MRDLVAAQDTFAATVVRAMQVMVEAFEDLEPAAQPSGIADAPRAVRRGTRITGGRTEKWSQEGAMKVAVVTPQMASGERGGAEALYRGLVGALRNAGHDTDEVPVYTDESCFDAVLESYARCYALDLRAYDLVISTKAPTFMVSHPNHVSYLLHTLRVFYDMFETEYGAGSELLQAQRRTVHALDDSD